MKKVLIPIDGSQYSLESIRLFKELELADSSELHLLNVQTISLPYESYHRLADKDRVLDYLEEEGQNILNQAAELLEGIEFTSSIRFGDAIAEILSYAEEIDASLIMVGSHGKSPLSSFILGSVTSKLLSYSKIPVLVSKMEKEPSA